MCHVIHVFCSWWQTSSKSTGPSESHFSSMDVWSSEIEEKTLSSCTTQDVRLFITNQSLSLCFSISGYFVSGDKMKEIQPGRKFKRPSDMVTLPDGRFAVRDDYGLQLFDEEGAFIKTVVPKGILGMCFGLATDGKVGTFYKIFLLFKFKINLVTNMKMKILMAGFVDCNILARFDGSVGDSLTERRELILVCFFFLLIMGN